MARVSVTVSPVAVICGCRRGYHSDGECVVAVLLGSPLRGRVTAVTVIVWLARCLYGCVHVTVIVWRLLCVPSDGGGGRYRVPVCGCDHEPFLCGSVCESVPWSMSVPSCGHVAAVVDGTGGS